LELFTATASPTAYKLATYFAAAPLSLPIMRLVQRVMLPDAKQLHLAEVFLSGLLKQVHQPIKGHDSAMIEYDFIAGVRDSLLDSNFITDSVQVFRKVTDFVNRNTGQVFDFEALLADPTTSGKMVINEKNRPFAEVAGKVLKRLGGKYAKAAEHLDQQLSSAASGEVIHKEPSYRSTNVKTPLQPFRFETITLDRQGKVIKAEQLQTEYFAEDLGNGVMLEMVAIPGGKFLMGSPKDEKDRSDDESPQHKVNVKPFYMGKYTITQAQWQAIMGNNPSRFKGDTLPVEMIFWKDAVEFCQRLSEKTGKQYRLPSEAEWEYACRAGTTTPFAFGETITPEFVNYNGGSPYGQAPKGVYRAKTTPVGSLGVANSFGLYDMHGNVWEWCEDTWHDSYKDAPDDGSAWVSGNSEYYVLRGGSWRNYANLCRAAYRLYVRINLSNTGLRVVVGVVEDS
jgi:formylglycine-generating enzyme required for sulfatase activity